MRIEDIRRMAHDIIAKGSMKNDFIEYKKSASFKDNIMASYTIRDNETIEHRIVYNWPLTAFEELATNCILQTV